ncbi:L,D-transpeptidase family protein [Roseovarius gahaiensis]|uniref:L,D-transpeptidase family protein n=2 Tax=Roseovarius gahaiensis TaxID=2716691 RepID=A0A967EJN6_9RHOB|nr:L,D-transpeptidase family protein [Roseovarius gahaiensis]NHQ75002.1 L,D-transpeptidase family protein [Roseovarius gahaiensis]
MTKAGVRVFLLAGLVACVQLFVSATPSQAVGQVTAFKQAVAEAAAQDRDLAAFYREYGYQPLWTGSSRKDRRRRAALFDAIAAADDHGLPSARYDADSLLRQLDSVRSPRDRGLAEVALSRAFLSLARDMQTGVLVPARIDSDIKRQVPYRDRKSYLTGFAQSDPAGFFRALPPKTNEYSRLMKEKLRLERVLAQGGWGPKVPADGLKPGQSGAAVVAMRNRLIAMGFLPRSATNSYDTQMLQAVQGFQVAHGLTPDGVAGSGTMAEINRSVSDRLKSIIVAMERERWMNKPKGQRHIMVNLTDFHARIFDNDVVTFETRAVIGKNDSTRRSPEFSDEMDHMVINPTWHVPRSIAVNEYLPQMKRNRNAVGHLKLYDRRGRQVSRSSINFNAYNASNFPYAIKQPPSQRNALGLVKFMFPNKYNIYLHDTPAKNLFEREKRDYSHGCIRLQKPFEFAYTLLAKQENDPKGFFHATLNTGRETRVNMVDPVPVHIQYRTAFTRAKGPVQYRRDVYGRDGRIWDALEKAGVSLRAQQG